MILGVWALAEGKKSSSVVKNMNVFMGIDSIVEESITLFDYGRIASICGMPLKSPPNIGGNIL